jgi:ABC-type multidrug transport system fused ATPase/permease subunit
VSPLGLLGPERRFFLLGLLGSFALALSLPLLPPLVVGPLYEEVLARGRYETVPVLLLRAVGLVGLGALGLYLQDALFGVGAARFGSRVRAAVYAALLRARPLEGSAGGRAARAALDVRELELFYAHDLTVVAAQGLTALAAVAVLFAQNARLTLLLGLVLLPLLLGLSWLGRRVEGAFRDAQAAAEQGTGLMGEGLARLEVIKAFRLEAVALERFERHNVAQDRATARRARLFALQAPLSQLATALGLAALLALTALEIRAGRLNAAGLSAYLSGLGILLGPIQMLAKAAGKWAAMREPTRALREALHLPPEPDTGGLERPPGGWRGEVTLERVVARYPGGAEPALDGLSLWLRPGRSWPWWGPPAGARRASSGCCSGSSNPGPAGRSSTASPSPTTG